MTASPCSQFLERDLRGIKAVTIVLLHSLGREKTDVKKVQSNKNSGSQIRSFQDVCKGEILWSMDAEKVITPNTKKKLWTVTHSERSNHKEQLASIAWSPGRAHTRELGARPPGALIQQPSGDGGDQTPTLSHVKMLLWQQHDGQQSARVWVRRRSKSSLYLFSWEGLETCRGILDRCR